MATQSNAPTLETGENLSPKCDNISMSSAKVVYETVQRDDRTSVYCPSPYATTRVSLYFQDNHSRDNVAAASDNCYDMPLLKVGNLPGTISHSIISSLADPSWRTSVVRFPAPIHDGSKQLDRHQPRPNFSTLMSASS